MEHKQIIEQLSVNAQVFSGLLSDISENEYLWKPQPDKWCLLEIICHLNDEEQEDFRFRIMHILWHPKHDLPSIDPITWVTNRQYLKQDFNKVLRVFLSEREKSIAWLHALHNPGWSNQYDHPKLGPLSAEMLLANWLAHDYIHIRQILKLKYLFLQHQTNQTLDYAGKW